MVFHERSASSTHKAVASLFPGAATVPGCAARTLLHAALITQSAAARRDLCMLWAQEGQRVVSAKAVWCLPCSLLRQQHHHPSWFLQYQYKRQPSVMGKKGLTIIMKISFSLSGSSKIPPSRPAAHTEHQGTRASPATQLLKLWKYLKHKDLLLSKYYFFSLTKYFLAQLTQQLNTH